VLEAVQRQLDQLDQLLEKMRERRKSVEHPSAPSRRAWAQPIS
jgi:hypothetical protein